MDSREIIRNPSRRSFLQVVSAGLPTLTLMVQQTGAKAAQVTGVARASGKFEPIDLNRYFNASPSDFGPREQAKGLSGDTARDGLVRPSSGKQNLRGIPFWLGPEGLTKKSWLLLSARQDGTAANSLEIPLTLQQFDFICVASFCDWDENEDLPIGADVDVIEKVGQVLAEVVLVYEDDSQHILPIRRRFEVNSPSIQWGHLCYTAEPHIQDAPRRLTDPLSDATQWGSLQSVVWDNHYPVGPDGRQPALLWISALANPKPTQKLKAVRLQAKAEDALAVCGLTLFRGRENPLLYERLRLYRFTLPDASAQDDKRWTLSVDLGIVARTYVLGPFEPEAWLSAPAKGLGEKIQTLDRQNTLYAEITASSDATLVLQDAQNGKRYEFDLNEVAEGKELEARPAGPRLQVLERHKVWLQGQVVDAASQRQIPVRLAFRSREGRYIAPYGHRTEINDAWFQDYGADVKLMDTSFAYVDGAFQVELPVGEVYLEMTKGFEYEAVRKKLTIDPGQREVKLEMSRFADLRSKGWMTADTHVHFLSPSTAVLEGQAEGLNLINLLAAQWSGLFTNVGDLSQGPITSRDGETMVWVGTENRQHILGHIGLLGTQSPVYPMSASGPEESYLGDPLWSSLADWADACRQREGLAVAVHFPYPTAEIAADIVLGKIDALEIWPMKEYFNSLPFLEWYRYLNCGYRLPAVGGTDKMGAYIPAGLNRTYAHVGQEAFNFGSWAKAVRRGNTFVTSGPLLFFQVEGESPGAEIKLGSNGGTLEVLAEARSYVPIHRLEVVMNGRVVASHEEREGVRDLTLKESIKITSPCWLAARCSSSLGPVTTWGFKIAAHTSPIYLQIPGHELFSASASSYFLKIIEGAEAWVETLAIRPDLDRLESVRKVFREARAELHSRLHKHGVPH